MSELRIGDSIEDNDPRMSHRVLCVVSICGRYVFASNARAPGLKVRIRADRIHTDGKPRKTGFSRLAGTTKDGECNGSSESAAALRGPEHQ